MRWSGRLVLSFALASLVQCTFVNQSSSPLTRNASADGHHLTTGVGTRDSNGHPYIRREVRDLYANFPDQWALYLLGLVKFQQVDQSDPLSFYRIAGIHSRPFELWQDAHGTPGVPVGPYCPHVSRVFLTWHRPYVALFEQELWKHIRSIADQAQQEYERWSTAADAFRIPYWDTGLGSGDGPIPEFLLSPRWTISGPNGTQLIDNPLFWYQFHPIIPNDFPDSTMANYNQTMRWPTTQYTDAKPQVGLYEGRYITDQRPRQDWVHDSFAWSSSFNNFSMNLESSHANIHIITGGDGSTVGTLTSYTGHMWDLGYSAFDPIFMLHHANYDRYLSLYTSANPDSWLQPEYVDGNSNAGTFWIPIGTMLDANYPLPPFWKDDDNFYTSEDVRSSDIFGYAYPETQYWNFNSTDEWRNDVRATIERLYPSSARSTLNKAIASGSDLTNVVGDGSTFIDWNIEVKASASEMPMSFSAKFSLVGDFSSDESIPINTWTRMMGEDHESGARKIRQAERKTKRHSTIEQNLSSSLSLTSSLLDQVTNGRVESLDPDVVVPYLKAHLTWNVVTGRDQKRLTPDQLESFVVKVTSKKVRIPSDPSHPLVTIGVTTSYSLDK